jgi:hypothetical protein
VTRRRLERRLALALAACLPFAGHAHAQPVLTLTAAQQSRLGIGVQVLTGTRRHKQVAAFAKVLDAGPLAQLESDLDAQIASAAASSAEASRARTLGQGSTSMSAKDAEAAIAQARQDQSKLDLLRRRLGLEWGPGLARLSDARRHALIKALSEGKAALVQVDTPDSEGQDRARSVEIDIGSGSVRAPVIGPSRTAEPRLQSSGLICLVSGPQAILFSKGLVQSARIDQSSSETGVILPRSALVRYLGSDWAYVRTGPETFERRLVETPEPEPDGDFTASRFRPGEEVVTRGTAALFAADRAVSGRGGG